MDGSNFYESDVNQTIHESFSIVKTIQGGSYSMEDTNLVNTKYGSFAQSLKEKFNCRRTFLITTNIDISREGDNPSNWVLLKSAFLLDRLMLHSLLSVLNV